MATARAGACVTSTCFKCKRELPIFAFHRHIRRRSGYEGICKTCRGGYGKLKWQNMAKERKLLLWAKNRAEQKGIPFDLTLADVVIPEICPVFNIPMLRPSLDRIEAAKGYVRGNVRVISHRANMLKSNATSEELALILKDCKKLARR